MFAAGNATAAPRSDAPLDGEEAMRIHHSLAERFSGYRRLPATAALAVSAAKAGLTADQVVLWHGHGFPGPGATTVAGTGDWLSQALDGHIPPAGP